MYGFWNVNGILLTTVSAPNMKEASKLSKTWNRKKENREEEKKVAIVVKQA